MDDGLHGEMLMWFCGEVRVVHLQMQGYCFELSDW